MVEQVPRGSPPEGARGGSEVGGWVEVGAAIEINPGG
jgi:hypothetical protein